MHVNLEMSSVMFRWHLLPPIGLQLLNNNVKSADLLNILQGTVYPIRNHIELPFVAAPFSLPDNYEYMLYCGVSEYFFKSASLSYYTAGAFNIKFLEEVCWMITFFKINMGWTYIRFLQQDHHSSLSPNSHNTECKEESYGFPSLYLFSLKSSL